MAIIASGNCMFAAVALALWAILNSPGVRAEEFLRQQQSTLRVQSVLADLQRAMSTATGEAEIRKVLKPIFDVLPKNKHGRIESPMLRYALHRYFLQKFSIQVRGLEPTQNGVNASSLVGNAEIYQERVPASVEAVLEGRFADNGFGLAEAATMAAVFEQLVLEPRGAAFEKALAQGSDTGIAFTREGLMTVLHDYILQWLAGDDLESAEFLAKNPDKIPEAIPQWDAIIDFVHGETDRIQHSHHHMGTRNPFEQGFSMSDLQTIARSITATFGMWWEQECQSIKSKLAEMDPSTSGRVQLSSFYRRSMDGEWRFSESEAYLRDLGSLDESSRWHGPQVVIPNYLLGPNNCIVSSTYYHVCCVNECESLLGEVERTVHAPVATPEQVLAAIAVMADEGQQQQKLWGFLTQQLNKIADKHRGKIPLHGRLFSQWMHYVFPQECPFPNKAGAARLMAPNEFGGEYVATPKEMRAHAKKAKRGSKSGPSREQQEESWMSQWTEDEELLTDYVELRASSSFVLSPAAMIIGALALFALLFVAQGGQLSLPSAPKGRSDSPLPGTVYCI